MGGMYDDNFYFQNPVDYMAGLTDPWFLEQLATCEIRLVTGSGPYEKSAYSYAMSGVLAQQGNPPSPGRLGRARRPRLAVLEGAAARVHLALVTPAPVSGDAGRQVELVQQVLPRGNHLLVVDPHVASAREHVDVGASISSWRSVWLP